MKPITNWTICISGYLQNRGDSVQGLPKLWHRLHNQHGHHACVTFAEWSANWEAMAEWIYRTSRNGSDRQPRILVVAYSWGAGYGAMALARKLAERGVFIDVMVTSDAVFHLGGRLAHLVGLSQLCAYWPWRLVEWLLRRFGKQAARPVIKLPANVREVHWFLQANSRLRGHEIMRQQGATLVEAENREEEATGGRNHTNMDDLPSFTETAMRKADELFGEPRMVV